MDFLIDFIVLPILCFVIVVLLLLFFASVYVYCTDEKYRKSMDAALESNKSRKKKRSSYPSSKQFDNYCRTGNRNYLWDNSFKG